jgi:hypothetical protein
MMRQYELVERVQKYKPDANEALLNKAYVYAMQKHGKQKRASGRPLYLPPARSCRHPHRHASRRIDDCGRPAARHDRGHRRPPAPRSTNSSARISAALVEGLTKIKKLDLVSKKAKQAENLRKLLLAISERRARAARQARRPPAQHAHARAYAPTTSAPASPKRRWKSMRRSPAAWVCRTCATSWRTCPSAT